MEQMKLALGLVAGICVIVGLAVLALSAGLRGEGREADDVDKER